MKHIAIIIQKLNGGGAERTASNLSLFFKDCCDVHLIVFDGREITYEQMMMWLIEGSLKQHGFYPYKGRTSKSCSSNSSHAIRNTRNLLTTAAVIAAI